MHVYMRAYRSNLLIVHTVIAYLKIKTLTITVQMACNFKTAILEQSGEHFYPECFRELFGIHITHYTLDTHTTHSPHTLHTHYWSTLPHTRIHLKHLHLHTLPCIKSDTHRHVVQAFRYTPCFRAQTFPLTQTFLLKHTYTHSLTHTHTVTVTVTVTLPH